MATVNDLHVVYSSAGIRISCIWALWSSAVDVNVCVFDSMQSSVATLKVSSVNRCSPCVERTTASQRTSPSPLTAAAANATSPVPVPPRSTVVHRLSNELRVASAASCGRSVSPACYYFRGFCFTIFTIRCPICALQPALVTGWRCGLCHISLATCYHL